MTLGAPVVKELPAKNRRMKRNRLSRVAVGKKCILRGADVDIGVLEVEILLLKIGCACEGFLDGIIEGGRW